MIPRKVIRLLSAGLLAGFALGCDDDDDLPTDSGPFLEVNPVFRGIDEGETLQLTATMGGQPVAVNWVSENPARATVSSTGLVTGVNACAGAPATPPCTQTTTGITATLASDANVKRSASITVIRLTGTAIQNGVPVTNISSNGARGSTQLYRIFVPAGQSQLRVTLAGGTGDVDLYVRRQTPPTLSSFTCASENAANNEVCVIANPQSGTWYILLGLWDPYAGVTLTATYN